MNRPDPLAVNEIYANQRGDRFRILRVDSLLMPDGERMEWARVYPMQGHKPWPFDEQWLLLQASLEDGRITRAPVSAKSVATKAPTFKPNAVKAMKRAWARIKELVNCPDLYVRSGRKRLIDQHAKKVRASPQTIVSLLRRFWEGGQTTDALYPNFHLCGTARRERHTGDAADRRTAIRARGRRPEGDALYSEPYLFGREEREAVVALAKELYDKGASTNHNLYKEVVKRMYCYTGAGGGLVVRPLGERPTPRQFRRAYNASLGVSERIVNEKSKSEYVNDYKAKTGTVFDDCVCVGHIFEIDSTILDVLVVARDNPQVVIGKATLYIIIDRFSRYVHGFHITLDDPSWANAMEAVLTLAEDKAAMCARWGYQWNPLAWIDHPLLPSFIAADRGTEYICTESSQISEGVAVGLINEPARLAVRKGMVEMAFHVLHVSLKEDAPGYLSPFEQNKRQAEDRTDRARYNLDQLARSVLVSIELHNMKVAAGYRMENCDVLSGEKASPVEIWRRDYSRSAGHISSCSHDHLRWKLLPQKQAIVTQFGIRVNKCFYGEDGGDLSEWFVAARHNVSSVWVTYDRRLVDTIWVHDRTNPLAAPVPVSLNSHSIRFKGLSGAEVAAILRRSKKLAKLAAEHNLQLELQAKLAHEKLRLEAGAAYDAVHEELGTSSRRDTHGQWRDGEARERRVEDAARPLFAPNAAEKAVDASSQPSQEPPRNQPTGSTAAAASARAAASEPEQPWSDEDLLEDLLQMGNT